MKPRICVDIPPRVSAPDKRISGAVRRAIKGVIFHHALNPSCEFYQIDVAWCGNAYRARARHWNTSCGGAVTVCTFYGQYKRKGRSTNV